MKKWWCLALAVIVALSMGCSNDQEAELAAGARTHGGPSGGAGRGAKAAQGEKESQGARPFGFQRLGESGGADT